MTRGPGTVLTPLATAVLVVLGMVVTLGTGTETGAADAPATTAPDYQNGSFARRLCGGGSGDLVCVAARTVAALTQGAERRVDAVEQGATCEVQSGLWVCFGVRSVLAQRGGTTYGDTFLTPRSAETLDPALLAHESEHVRQWQLFGPDFALMYLIEGTDPCTNDFEVAAGLDAGGYSCP